MGGAKISDKIGVISNLLAKCDAILIGGGMANTFLAAQGYDLAKSLVEAEAVEKAKELLASSGEEKIQLPVDLVVADKFAADAARQVVAVDAISAGWMALDIGPATIAHYANRLAGARTVVWNGPMGVFELEPFAKGTFAIADILANLKDATTIIGGGDSAAAVRDAGVEERITHVSTGGGASLEFLEGIELPGVAALNDR
jgi:phosphoglycerate kinase